MFRKSRANLSPKGERFKHFEGIRSVLKSSFQPSEECFTRGGERFGERFKSHKYMENNIFKKNNNNLSPIHPTHARATRCAHARIGCR